MSRVTFPGSLSLFIAVIDVFELKISGIGMVYTCHWYVCSFFISNKSMNESLIQRFDLYFYSRDRINNGLHGLE